MTSSRSPQLPETTPKNVLVAPAWPYASGPRHLGHVVGFAVPADIFARYHRLKGNDVLMVSGTDEHGTPVMVTADREGVSPREIAERYNELIRQDLRDLGISYDCFTRTTTPNHARITQDIFRTLYDHGHLIEQTTLGAFSATTGNTLPDRYIEGTCPICGFPEARGDQCDNCGNQLDPTDLINPRSRVNGEEPEFRETEHFFFDLPAFADQLAAWVQAQEHWRPNVRAFSINYVKELKPRAITRDLDWGVPVPLPGWEDREHKRIYVWFDAVIGYLSASIEWAAEHGTPDAWKAWWQDPQVRGYYFMGKDNITFHTVIWPAILLGVGGLNLPYDIPSVEFLTMEGRQLSTSRSHVILVRDVLERYGPDPLRYYLAIAGPENQDTDFTWSEFVRRNNDELVGTWGNLVHRTLVNAQRNFGAVPEPGELTERDSDLIRNVEQGFEGVGELYAGARFKAALTEAMRLAQLVNQYLGEEEPWQTIKRDRARAATVLYVAVRCVDNLKVLLAPVLPFSAQRLHELLGYEGVLAPQPEVKTVAENGESHLVLGAEYPKQDLWRASTIEPGRGLPPPAPLFRKLDHK